MVKGIIKFNIGVICLISNFFELSDYLQLEIIKLARKEIHLQESSSNWVKYYINIVFAINFILVWKLTFCQVASEHQ